MLHNFLYLQMTDLHASLKNSTSEATRKYKDLVREVKKFAKQIEGTLSLSVRYII